MLTGDRPRHGGGGRRQLGIDEVIAEVLPEREARRW